MKRTQKFYRKNEAEVMKSLGFRPTKNSGSGWIEKEDGISDHCICQLKSTDKRSISIKQDDIRTLEYNADASHKIPVFAIQFLNTDEVWIMVKPEDIYDIKDIVSGKKIPQNNKISVDIEQESCYTEREKRDVKQSLKARKQYKNESKKRYERTQARYKKSGK